MTNYQDPDTGRFVIGTDPHNKGLKKYYHPEQKVITYRESHPGEPWVEGGGDNVPPSHKGTRWFRNTETGVRKRFLDNPGSPWVKGRGELSWTTTGGQNWYHNPVTGERTVARECPEGWKGGRGEVPRIVWWSELTSRANCRKWGCDSLYILRLTTKDGRVFGKWGSSSERTFHSREKEFHNRGFTFEVVFWDYFGERTEDVEAFVGRKLSEYPWKDVPRFFGFTETFEWTPETEKLLKEIVNALEENPPS